MKKLFKPYLLVVLLMATGTAKAQKLFEALPETLSFQGKALESVFDLNPGSSVDLTLAPGLRVTGVVKSNQKVYDNLQTIVIESSNYNKARLFISKSTGENNKVKYMGRMLGRGFQDGIELKGDEAGNNTIRKINLNEMIIE